MLSIFDLFKIGIGPSSSHTVGPMVAGRMFADLLGEKGLVPLVSRIQAELYGSLALTGEGHGTLGALLNGLEGARPDTVDPVHLAMRTAKLKENADLILAGKHKIGFEFARDIVLHKGLFLPRHSNALTLTAYDGQGNTLLAKTYYSIGGGFVRSEEDFDREEEGYPTPPYPLQDSH